MVPEFADSQVQWISPGFLPPTAEAPTRAEFDGLVVGFTRETGVSLPAQFWQWHWLTGRGRAFRPKRNVEVEVPTVRGQHVGLEVFFGLTDGTRGIDSLLANAAEGFFPFASDPGGNFCGFEHGTTEVVFRSHDNIAGSHFVAADFAGFLNSLRLVDAEVPRPWLEGLAPPTLPPIRTGLIPKPRKSAPSKKRGRK